ncbi:MAG: hypothetical protein AB1331_08230 [Bacillota bacterium]
MSQLSRREFVSRSREICAKAKSPSQKRQVINNVIPLDYACAERLHPVLLMAEILAAHGELTLTDEIRRQLAQISRATPARRLERLPKSKPKTAGLKMTRSRPYQKNDNPHVEQKNRQYVRETIAL